MRRALVAACAAGLWCAATPADAAPVRIGVFAPSAPFPSTAARVELASRLAMALGKKLPGGASGRVYARAADFAAAVRSGEVTLALVDPSYLASTGTTATVLAAALRDGEVERGWQLVTREGAAIASLRGKRVLVPSVGGREPEFVLDVLLGGELERGFFGKIEPSPDTASALAALALGKADAAVVPATDELPPGTAPALALPALPNPVLVAFGALSAPERSAVLAAATGFAGDATIAGFRAASADVVLGVARRFTPPVKRAPFLVPAPRLIASELALGRRWVIERTPAAAFAIAPAGR